MKQKELIQLVAAVIILSIAGLLIFMQFAPKSSGKPEQLTYEKITKLHNEFSTDALQALTDASIARDFYAPPDLNSGVGNTQPFTPIR
ncbi:MAG TPA: hypothetical protein VMR98_02065 [Candidatus Polarisedimenticolaceae bacterium]|nr:hypothetical protein [Candidatus Polarisedimenticolaceae bacterium]